MNNTRLNNMQLEAAKRHGTEIKEPKPVRLTRKPKATSEDFAEKQIRIKAVAEKINNFLGVTEFL
jgi:hypothetical protein